MNAALLILDLRFSTRTAAVGATNRGLHGLRGEAAVAASEIENQQSK
jgi:hypothetical protein